MRRQKGKHNAGSWFRDWANDYDNTLGKLDRHHRLLDMAVRMAKVKSGDQVLDIGCGTGLLSLKFLQAARCKVTAVDSSKAMLAILRSKVPQLGLSRVVKVKKMAAAELDFPAASFNVAAATVALHYLNTTKLSAGA